VIASLVIFVINKTMVFTLLFGFLFAQKVPPAQPSPFELMLQKDQEIVTKQAKYKVNGVIYDRIEADGKYYYFKALRRGKDIPLFMCDMPVGHESPRLIEGSLKLYRRKRIFFTALVEKCTTRDPVTGHPTSSKRTYIEVDPVIGIHLPDNEKDLIKNKKVGVPLKHLNTISEAIKANQVPTPPVFFGGEF
jgi:hypothetical protein